MQSVFMNVVARFVLQSKSFEKYVRSLFPTRIIYGVYLGNTLFLLFDSDKSIRLHCVSMGHQLRDYLFSPNTWFHH